MIRATAGLEPVVGARHGPWPSIVPNVQLVVAQPAAAGFVRCSDLLIEEGKVRRTLRRDRRPVVGATVPPPTPALGLRP